MKRTGPQNRRRRRPTALERMDEHLERTNNGSNAELIRLMRLALFRSVDALQASGSVKLPEWTTSPAELVI